MPKFHYLARDSSGNRISGIEELASQDELISRLQAKNLLVISITTESAEEKVAPKPGKGIRFVRFKHYGISSEDLIVFSRQLATLLAAGVTILKSLDIISKQVASRKFYMVIQDLKKDMESGLSFHEAMSRHTRVFSDLWVNLVESGEASGNLAVILNRIATYLERSESFKKKIISNLIYPVILLCAGTGALIFLTIKIIPTFAEIFKGFNIEMPLLTRILITVSFAMRKYFFIAIVIIAMVILLVRGYIRTKDGRRFYDKIKFSLPLFGDFFRALVVERFSSDISTLIESGVPLLYSLEITEHSITNPLLSDIIHNIKEGVREGKPLSYGLEKSEFFEPMVVQMAAVGEEIGDLPQMLKRINVFYQENTETFLVRFSTMFEPLMLLFMGGVIGIMVIGMFMPIFQIATISGK